MQLIAFSSYLMGGYDEDKRHMVLLCAGLGLDDLQFFFPTSIVT